MAGASNKIVKDRKTIGFIRRRHPKTQIMFRSMPHQGHDASKAEGRLQVTSILRNSTQNYRRRHYPRRSVVGGVQRPLRALVLPQQHPPARGSSCPVAASPAGAGANVHGLYVSAAFSNEASSSRGSAVVSATSSEIAMAAVAVPIHSAESTPALVRSLRN